MMKKIIHLFFPVIMLSLFSCHDTEAKHEMEEPDFDGFVKISLQSQITGVQPMTGIVLWADNAKRNTDAISLEYSYMQYTDIVKEKGVYDWTPLEQILDAVASRKHQAIIRFWYTYPGYESAVPQYIRELPDYEETVALRENGPDFPTGGIPSYNGSTKSFIRSLQNGMTMIRVWHSFKPVSAYGLSTIYTMGRELWDRHFPPKNFKPSFSGL